MSKLYIRDRSKGYICFLHSKQELVEFTQNYLPGRHLIIGDLAQFNVQMKQILLKFIEENPSVDCYSTEDIVDATLQSRFYHIIKEPYYVDSHNDVEEFLNSSKDYSSVLLTLSSLPYDYKLRAPLCTRNILKLLL